MARNISLGMLLRRFYRRVGGGAEHSIEGTSRRGFIVIQIDGLSQYLFKLALKKRQMPFLGRLIRRKKHVLSTFKAGLPATTPAFQAAVMYGNDETVPGFRWFERDGQRFMIMKGLDDTAEIEKRLDTGVNGILRGGVSYCTLFSGGADEANFTASKIDIASPKGALNIIQMLLLLVLNLGAVLRVIGLSFMELGTELYDEIKVRMRGGLRRNAFAFPFVRIISNVVLREISTAMAVSDIYRGVPSVYINYFGYDELSHHRSPVSIMARLSLRGIDAQIRKLWKAAQRAWPGRYDFFILSDHGQVPTVPFEKMYSMQFSDYLSNVLLKKRVSELRPDGYELRASRTISFINYLNSLEPALPRWTKRLVDRLVLRLEKDLSGIVSKSEAQELGSIYVLPTSDMAHIYFNDRETRHTVEELEAEHPGVIATIIGHPGVLLAAGSSDRGVMVFSKKGLSVLNPSTCAVVEGPDPFQGFDAPPWLAGSLVHLIQMRHSGDLVVFLARRGPRVLNFQEELGGHGGLYPEEQNAFLIHPPGVQLAGETKGETPGALELYRLLSGYTAG